MILMWHHISNDLECLTQLPQKLWHKVNDLICHLATLLYGKQQKNSGCIQSLDWTTGLADWTTGLADWTELLD